MQTLSWEAVRRRRLARNFLAAPEPAARLVEVAAAVGGLQAQVLSAAELALGARLDVDRETVRASLWETRRLVKTYGPRGTLHLLPAHELPLWMAAMQARQEMLDQPWYERSGLTSGQGQALMAAIGQALDGQCLERHELAEAASHLAGAWAREYLLSTWGEMLPPAAYAGLLCYGPSRAGRVTFVRADQWVGAWEHVDPRHALLEILRRYLAACGPITPQDFARWFWIKPAQAGELMDNLAPELVEVRIENQPAWLLRRDAGDLGAALPAGRLKLVPQYDCYVLGSNPRERIVPPAAHKRIFAIGRGRFEGAVGLPVLLIDGLVAGVWERRERRRQVDLLVQPFEPLSGQQTGELETEVARLEKFFNLPAALIIRVI